jgi:hypothetical protein
MLKALGKLNILKNKSQKMKIILFIKNIILSEFFKAYAGILSFMVLMYLLCYLPNMFIEIRKFSTLEVKEFKFMGSHDDQVKN